MTGVRLQGLVAAGGIGVLAALAGLGVILEPRATLVLAAAAAVVAVVVLRPLWTAHIALFLAATSLPAAVPYSVPAGHVSVFLYEPFLYLAVACLVWRYRPSRAAVRMAAGLGVLVLGAAALALVRGNPRTLILTEGRGLVVLAAALLLTASLAGTEHARGLLTTVRWSLWVSAAATLLGSVAGVPLNGRTDTASLIVNGSAQGSSALRLLGPGTQFALAVVCACLALLIAGRVPSRRLVPYLLPALVITFLGFSRNALLGIAAAVVVAILADRSPRLVRGGARLLALSAAAAAVIGVAGLASDPARAWLAGEGQAFHDRVVVGLDSTVRSLDASALARQQEDQAAMTAIEAAPVIGHGLGYQYRPGTGDVGSFDATTGRYYLHNFYYWLLVKAGALGLALWVLLVGPPLVLAVLRSSTRGLAFAAAAAGLLAVCVVAPLPIDDSGSSAVTMGIALGGLVAAVPARRDATERASRLVEQLV